MTLQGSWIWYELMTPDADGSKAFYDRVVGWNIQTTHGDSKDYGFIVNPDGGMTFAFSLKAMPAGKAKASGGGA